MGTYLLTYWLFFVGVLCICFCPCAHVCVCPYKYIHVEVRGLSSVFLHIFVFIYLFGICSFMSLEYWGACYGVYVRVKG